MIGYARRLWIALWVASCGGAASALGPAAAWPQEVELATARVEARASTLETGDPADVEARIARGDELVSQRRWAAARLEYAAAMGAQRAAGELPTVALRRIANAYYFEGRLLDAARALDRLAREAAAFGHLPAQVRARADAAVLYAMKGHRRAARERRAQLEQLLTSPFLPDSTRVRMMARLTGP